MSARQPVRPHHRHTIIKQLNQVWQPKRNSRFYLEGNRMADRTEEKKEKQQKQLKSCLFQRYF